MFKGFFRKKSMPIIDVKQDDMTVHSHSKNSTTVKKSKSGLGAELQAIKLKGPDDDSDHEDPSTPDVETVDLSHFTLSDIETPNHEVTRIERRSETRFATSVLLSQFLLYATSQSHYDAMFLLALNDLMCNPSKINEKKLRALQYVFLSHREEEIKSGKRLIVSCEDKLLINPEFVDKNTPEKTIDNINQQIDVSIEKKLSDIDGLTDALRRFSVPIINQEMRQFKDYKANKKSLSNGMVGLTDSLHPIMEKLQREADFQFCNPISENPERSLFKNSF